VSGFTAAVAIAAGALFLALGVRYPRVQQPLVRSGFHADLVHAAVNGPMIDAVIAYVLLIVWSPGLMRAEPLWLQAITFLILGDLVKWTVHMLHHRVPFLWRFHRLHHCTQQMDALSAVRLHPVEVLLSRSVFAAVFICLAGVHPAILVTYSTLDAVQGLWIHSNTRVKTRRLNYILSTQEFHHWHHANDPRAVNRNFGGFLSIWDWIFGTAYCPADEEPDSFGIPEMPTPPARYLDHLLSPLVPVAARPDVMGAGDRAS
jgi:sterol desaturase/sphingolipid hydroxylase (fatty acid hydroxylase superfamily)